MDFLPRALKAKRKFQIDTSENGTPTKVSSSQPAPASLNGSTTGSNAKPVSKPPSALQDEDRNAIAGCLGMLLSDWTIEMDSSLREALRRGTSDTDEPDGFISLSTLLSQPNSDPTVLTIPQSTLLPLIRLAHPDIQIRIALTEPSSMGSTRGMGMVGYEVAREFNGVEREDTGGFWRDRTVYLEDIPPDYRSKLGLIKLLQSIYPDLRPLVTPPASASSVGKTPSIDLALTPQASVGNVQAILTVDEMLLFLTSPFGTDPRPTRKRSDQDPSRMFLVFRDVELVRRVVEDLRWSDDERRKKAKRRREESVKAVEPDGEDVVGDGQAARRKHERQAWDALEACGTRAISKTRFDELQAEYLARQNALRQANAEAQVRSRPPRLSRPDIGASSHHPYTAALVESATSSSELTYDKDYPLGCVLLLRNVEVDTNKTALRALCNELAGEEGAVSYVEWDKGMDSAHLRVLNAKLAGIIKRASEAKVDLGIRVDILEGRPEELYWYNMPEQIRSRALQASRGDVDPTEQTRGGKKRRR